MDQLKIGKFIASRRKLQNLTQASLAEKLSVTDRAVSKWERGLSLPDASIMLSLCDILKITVNDLLCGEVVSMDNYEKQMEQNLIEMTKQKQEADKRLLRLEIVMGVIAVAVMLALTMVASYVQMEAWLRIFLILVGFLLILVLTPFMIKIEQTAGYYKCAKCGHCYVPTYKSVFMAPHVNRTRHMRCPKCNEKSWHKKVLTKE